MKIFGKKFLKNFVPKRLMVFKIKIIQVCDANRSISKRLFLKGLMNFDSFPSQSRHRMIGLND